jgi:hypothetical protein
LGSSKAELIVNDPNMYQYAFRRIENSAAQPMLAPVVPTATPARELPAN